MPLSDPPIQETIQGNGGTTPQTWLEWFQSITDSSKNLYSGSWVNNEGNTVTVVDGKITDVS